MNSSSELKRLIAIVVPTPLQAIGAFIISLVAILALQRQALLLHFGAGQLLEPAVTKQFNLQVAHVLGLSLVGQFAIIVFWAVVGLVAYLVVWLLNNAFIEARNEVIVDTSYTNKNRHGFDFLGMILKLITLAAMVASTAILPYGLNTWLRLWQELLTNAFSLHAFALAFGSVIGFAAELYLSFMLFQVMVDRFRH